ncbi:profilin II [Cavenderia fasciculata]|uniref:Profilin n=1 Tax=Cavenderia fasciculata TaxID=261658 RepID=F4Q4X7_CACFS|nr:profilin II [Cavenderia fasciculata]EGG17083.1 profilin II [Cavenderia fasciculata]|eukprot:XP_004355567.1 profilin II [Cavenderia fasciculata]
MIHWGTGTQKDSQNIRVSKSWQSYVDTNLLGAGLKQATIIGAAGGSWAASAGFKLAPEEEKALIANFANPANASATGILANKVKYLTLKADPRSIYGKQGAGGIVCVKTVQAIIVGVYDQTLQPGAAATVVEKLADYLIDSGF